MLSSRAAVFKNILQCLRSKPNEIVKPQIRNHGTWSYRVAPPDPPRSSLIGAELIMGFTWWWILWHFWTEPEHVTGEWPIVEPSEWSDEELGIPPDSMGPAPRI